MPKLNSAKITYNLAFTLILLGVWILGVMVLKPVKADAYDYYGGSYLGGYNNYTYPTPYQYSYQPYQANYYQTPYQTPYQNVAPTTSSQTSDSYNTTTSSSSKKVTTASNTVGLKNPQPGDYSNLAANALYGSSSFLPSGLIQWLFFAIIILLIVIFARKIFSPKYFEGPLKHA